MKIETINARGYVKLMSAASLALLAIATNPAFAQVTKVDCGANVINTAGYTISSPGLYCLGKDLIVPATLEGFGVSILSSNVTLDLNGYRISGPHAGGAVTTTTYYTAGILATGTRDNITVRNGSVSGLDYGVNLYVGSGLGILVEDIKVDHVARYGIYSGGSGGIIRGNQITEMNAALNNPALNSAMGIYVTGHGNRIVNNTVTRLRGNLTAIGISAAILSVVEGNLVSGVPGADPYAPTYGIEVGSGSLVVDNRIDNLWKGIQWLDTVNVGLARNLTNGTMVPYYPALNESTCPIGTCDKGGNF